MAHFRNDRFIAYDAALEQTNPYGVKYDDYQHPVQISDGFIFKVL